MLLPVFKPYIRRADMDSVLSCLISDEIGHGSVSAQLVSQLSEYLEVKSGFLFRDYYRAISIAIDSLGLRSGSRIIISPLAPGVYIDVFREKGLIPLMAEVNPETAAMDHESVLSLTNNTVDALLIFSPLGTVADMEFYKSLNIPLIEDISENFGGSFNDKMCGSFGKVTIFSMEPDKILTCGGGAAVLVKDECQLEDLADICDSYSNEIFLSDINASLALMQLKSMEEILHKRGELAEIFVNSLNKTEHKTLRSSKDGSGVSFSFPVLLKSSMKEVSAYVMKKNIEPRRAFQRTALDVYGNKDNLCPVASGLQMRTILFPLYPSLGRKNAEMISKVISTIP